MKLRILVKIVEKLLGMTDHGNEPRADMYLPERLLAMAMVFLAGGIALGIYCIISFSVWAIVGAVAAVGFGVAMLLCWRNQSIHMISQEQFTYTTMFGKTYTYSFSDIQGLRRNADSMTMFVADKKVHIESMAVVTDRLAERINRELKRLYG